MTDKEKQIEEMARDIAFEFCPNRNLHKKWGNEAQCYSDDNFSECTTIKNAVDKLYNAGYRKIPEGSVVLSKEEYAKDFCSQFNKGYERGSKETAREILEAIKLKAWGNNADVNGNIWSYSISIYELAEIAKQFGVEIKE